MNAKDEKRHSELSEMIGLLKTHSRDIDNELLARGDAPHTWLIIDAAKRLRDALAKGWATR